MLATDHVDHSKNECATMSLSGGKFSEIDRLKTHVVAMTKVNPVKEFCPNV
jgi:hypothetical protein